MAKIVTLRELEEHWSIDDLMDAHEALDLELEYQQYENDKIRKEMKRGAR